MSVAAYPVERRFDVQAYDPQSCCPGFISEMFSWLVMKLFSQQTQSKACSEGDILLMLYF